MIFPILKKENTPKRFHIPPKPNKKKKKKKIKKSPFNIQSFPIMNSSVSHFKKIPQKGFLQSRSLPDFLFTLLLLYWNCSCQWLLCSKVHWILHLIGGFHIDDSSFFPEILLVTKLLLSPGFPSIQLAIPLSLCWLIFLWTSKPEFPGLNPTVCFCLHLSLSLELALHSLPGWSHWYHEFRCHLYIDDDQICTSGTDSHPKFQTHISCCLL